MGNLLNLAGERFGRLSVVSGPVHKVLSSGRKIVAWECVCECGSKRTVSAHALRCGKTKSCGCLGVDLSRERTAGSRHHNFKHGLNKDPAYNSWNDARRRALGMKKNDRARYSDRGIGMCMEWQEDFTAFLRDMGPRPDGMTLDRIDNNRGYEPGNCRWATRKEQSVNRRTTRFVVLDGETVTSSEAAVRLGLGKGRVSEAARKLGISHQEAVDYLRARLTRAELIRDGKLEPHPRTITNPQKRAA